MQIFRIFIFLLVFHALAGMAVKVTNNTHLECAVTFITEDFDAITLTLNAGGEKNSDQAFGLKDGEKILKPFVLTIRFFSEPEFSFSLDGIDPDAKIILDAPKSLAPKNFAAPKPLDWSSFALNLATNGLWFLGIAASAPTGGALGSTIGTELGAKIGIHIMQQKTSGMSPIFGTAIPLLLSGSGSMGMAAGYTLGAASGAVILPLSFAAGWYICSAVINFFSKDAKTDAVLEIVADDSWVLIESTP